MPRQTIYTEPTLLVSFREARRLLGEITSPQLYGLISDGLLRPHPKLADRIARREIERFALEYDNAETDTTSRRAMDDQPEEAGGRVPSLRLRAH